MCKVKLFSFLISILKALKIYKNEFFIRYSTFRVNSLYKKFLSCKIVLTRQFRVAKA